jgi:hypothetical protein
MNLNARAMKKQKSSRAPGASVLIVPSAFITHRAGFAIWVFRGGMLRPQRDLNGY